MTEQSDGHAGSAVVAEDIRIDAQSISERVYTVLRAGILSGEFRHGERLHQEALSHALGVSRTPLREALGRLAADGLVELLPQRGARVADVTAQDMLHSYESRLIIEPAAARLAAQRTVGELGCETMQVAVAALRAASKADDIHAAFIANRAFHLAVVEAAGNPWLLRFAEMLWAGRVGLAVYERQRGLSTFLVEDADAHSAIADAIVQGDGDQAEQLMYEHIAQAMHWLSEDLTDERTEALGAAR